MKKKKKQAGPLSGILFIILGIGMLWWNEGNDVKNIKTVEEARSVLVNVSSDKVDSANDGKLVSTNGKLEIADQYLLDSTFNLQSPKTAKLVRVVEMLQWVEDEEEDSEGYVTYHYEKKWLTEIEDSDRFSDSGKVNPKTMPYEKEVFFANNVTVGAFSLSDEQKAMLSTGATVTLGDTVSIPVGYYKTGNYISSVSDLSNADVGDVRISFKYNNDKEVSILAKQNGSSFTPYTSEQGKTLFRVESGILTGEEIIEVVEKENNIFKWVLRILGIVFNMAGFAALLSPIVFLVKWIPFLGNGIAKFIKGIGSLVGLAVSFVVIAIAWIFFRPLIGILLLAGVVGIVFVIAMLIKKSRAVPAPEQAAVAGVPGMTMQVPQGQVPMQQQPQVVMGQPGVVQQPMMQGQAPQSMMGNSGVVQQPVMNQQPVMQPQVQPVVQQPMQQQMMGQPQQPMMQQQVPVQPQVVQQPVQMAPQQPVNPLEQQQLMAQQVAQQQQVVAQQQQDPMSIFGQNGQQ